MTSLLCASEAALCVWVGAGGRSEVKRKKYSKLVLVHLGGGWVHHFIQPYPP